MGEQLKVQTLYDVAEEDGKNLVWTDVYVSGTEGASGVYSTRRLTWTQLLAYINSNISAIVGSGTLNYLPKWTPDGATIGDSQILDDGTNISINTAINTDVKINGSGDKEYGIKHTNTLGGYALYGNATGSSAISGISCGVGGTGGGSSVNYGGVFGAVGGTGAVAVGIQTTSSATSTIRNVGVSISVLNGAVNYGLAMKDGSEGTGKFIKCVDGTNGYANWASLTASDISSFVGLPCEIQLAVSDETTALTTGTGKLTFRMPHAMTLTEVRASLTTAQTSGGILTVDINKNGSTIFISNWLTIDNGEKTSVTALDQPIINVSSLADDDEITIDIDQIGSGDATGLKILLKGTRA